MRQEAASAAKPSALHKLSNLFFYSKTPAPSLILFLAIISAVFTSVNPLFFSFDNLNSVVNNLTFLGVLSVGMTIIIIAGEFDLSVGSNIAVCAVLIALMFGHNFPIIAVIGIVLVLGSLIGMLNGWLVTRVGINSIIATLGTMTIFKGVALLFAQEQPMIYKQGYAFLGRGYVLRYIPISAVYLFVLVAAFSLTLKYTVFGRNLYYVGGNPVAARLSGISVAGTKFLAFIVAGVVAAFSSIILTGQLAMGRPEFGEGSELEAITVVALGGVSISGGSGNFLGVTIALLLMTVIGSGMVLMDVPIFWRIVARGALLIVAITVDALKTRRRAALLRARV